MENASGILFNENNELVGFDVDVAREVASRLGVTLKPVTTEWSGIIVSAQRSPSSNNFTL